VASVGDGAVVEDKVPTGPGPTPYPAAYHGVIGVAAVDERTYPLQTSPWGPYVDLVAPGSNVQGANRGGGHLGFTGSSFAAAFVTASAALVRSKWPELSATEVARRLFATASPAAGGRSGVGYGMVDPYRALTEGLSDEEPADMVGASVEPVDPATAARLRQWQDTGTVALVAVGVGVLLAAVMLALLTLLPKGVRRRWRPGRARPIPEPKRDDGDLSPAPVKLFENLEID
jgi:subtilisin family serine protease